MSFSLACLTPQRWLFRVVMGTALPCPPQHLSSTRRPHDPSEALTLALYSAPGTAFLATGRCMPEPPAVGRTQRLESGRVSLPLESQGHPSLKGMLESRWAKNRGTWLCPLPSQDEVLPRGGMAQEPDRPLGSSD
jgi:hypothetical protein